MTARRPSARPAALAALVAAACTGGAGAAALDARALALGGSSVADGRGAHGVAENPASLAALQRSGVRGAVAFGTGIDARDHADLSGLLADEEAEDLADDLEDEIDRLSGSDIDCNPLTDTDDTVCLGGTARLGELSGDALDIIGRADERPVSGLAEARLGVAVTVTELAFALHAGVRGSARGAADVSDGDRDYAGTLESALGDGALTLGEVRDNAIEFEIVGNSIEIAEPEDIVTSTGRGGAMYRVQGGVSLATGIAFDGVTLDVGVTPKFSRLTAWGTDVEFADTFDDDAVSIEDRFEDSEVEESSFTFDAGVAMDLSTLPLRVAAVARNVIPESIETEGGVEFETTPQLIVGVLHRRGLVGLTADLALNEAEIDGIETRPAAIGVELGTPTFAIRGGVGADFGREDDELAVTLGAKLGPLEIGGRLAGVERGQLAAQIAFGF